MIEYRDWTAVHDHMAKRLHVHGTCVFPHPGYQASLEDHAGPQGINDKDLIIDLVVGESGGGHPDVETQRQVDYERPWGYPYTSVSVQLRGLGGAGPPAMTITDVH